MAAAQSKGTNGLAIASLITSLVGLNVIGIILGFVALSQLKTSGEGGRGLAIAGIIIGFISLGIMIIVMIWFFVFFNAVTEAVIESPYYYNELFNGLDNSDFNFNFTY
jgi:hypothetical protein